MKTRTLAIAAASALLSLGLIPFASAQSILGSAQEGIEVITVVGKRSMPILEDVEVITVVGKRAMPILEGVEVITVVGTRPAATVASACFNKVMADGLAGATSASDVHDAQALEARYERISSTRQAVRDCIEQTNAETARS